MKKVPKGVSAGVFVAVLATAILSTLTFAAASAWAGCRIANETNYSFTVTSGNTSNQSVGAHTTTSIAPGKIMGTSKEGKTIGGSCKDGDNLIVKEEKGVPLILPK